MAMGLWSLRRDRVRRTGKFGLAASLAASLAVAPVGATSAPTLPLSAAAAPARPALWVVGDGDTLIYLFGTFHALSRQTPWFGQAVKTAFDRSDELVLETVIPDSPEAIRAALLRFRQTHQPAQPVSTGLTGARVGMTAARSAGLSTADGADSVLQRAANAAGKPVVGLEQFEEQLAMYDRLPGPPPGTSADTQRADPAVTALMRQMLTAWTSGDPRTFEAVVGAMNAQSPRTYRILFRERNANWAHWIRERLKQPGTVFVAVGTGHLVGSDSVQAQLAAAGIRTARIN
ncbi:TraB/GumN family protein [Sphingomonas sp. BN140010]|uniref:TraB/GumN family protein n=1 Tax=Sphingomonas arvum TaxID=2992113 RepID=A0ABT3JDI1_9SPHN|nr:TraB/GumN family protein [Sphingomonas sp. BN140010]MCW3797145.1 TraB/GumN family protein [Sphingomonas sp. BN140010]